MIPILSDQNACFCAFIPGISSVVYNNDHKIRHIKHLSLMPLSQTWDFRSSTLIFKPKIHASSDIISSISFNSNFPSPQTPFSFCSSSSFYTSSSSSSSSTSSASSFCSSSSSSSFSCSSSSFSSSSSPSPPMPSSRTPAKFLQRKRRPRLNIHRPLKKDIPLLDLSSIEFSFPDINSDPVPYSKNSNISSRSQNDHTKCIHTRNTNLMNNSYTEKKKSPSEDKTSHYATQTYQINITRRIKQHGDKKDYKRALKLFRTAHHKNLYMCNATLSAFAKSAKYIDALEFIDKEMPSYAILPDLVSFNSCLSALEKAKKFDIAYRLVHDMNQGVFGDVRPDIITYSTAISACEKAAQPQHALNLFNDLLKNNISPDLIVYNSCISACAQRGWWLQAKSILDRIFLSGLQPDRISYNAYIFSLHKANKWQNCLQILNSLRNINIEPDLFTYNACISACAKARKWEKAVELLRDIRHASSGLLEPDIFSYSAAIDACAQAGNLSQSLSLIHEMKSRNFKPNIICYTSLIKACQAANDLAQCLAVLEEIKKDGLVLDLISYNACLSVCRSLGNYDQMKQILQDMNGQKIQYDRFTYSICISAFTRYKKYDAAIAMYDDMVAQNIESDLSLYSSVMNAYSRSGDSDKAFELFEQMKMKGCPLDVIVYGSLINCCARGRNADHALVLIAEMKSKGLKPNVVCYATAMKACRRNQWKKCIQIYYEMVGEGIVPNLTVYRTVLNACRTGKSRTKALEIYNQMVDEIKLDINLCALLVLILWESDKRESAYTIVNLFFSVQSNKIAEKEAAVEYKDAIVSSLENQLATVKTDVLKHNAFKSRGYLIVIAKLDPKDWMSVLKLYEQAKTENFIPSEALFYQFLSACFKGRQPHQAWKIFLDMAKYLEPNSRLWSFTVVTLLHTGAMEEAFLVMKSMRAQNIFKRPKF